MSARHARIGDAISGDPGDRIIAAIALALMVAVFLIITFALGALYQSKHFIASCEAGEKFYALGDPDVPYRCTRVTDYPPTQGNP